MKKSIIKKAFVLIIMFSLIGFIMEVSGIRLMMKTMENESMGNHEKTFVSIIENMYAGEEKNLKLRLYDYAVWDEMYYAVRNMDYQWSYENGTKFLYEDDNYELDLILVKGEDNDYYEYYGRQGIDLEVINKGYFNYVRENKKMVVCYDLFEDELYRIAISPISNNDFTLFSGYYLMGQKIDDNYIDKINKEFLNFEQFLGNEVGDDEKVIDVEHGFFDFDGNFLYKIYYYFDDSVYIETYNKMFGHTLAITIAIIILINILFFNILKKTKRFMIRIMNDINIVAEGKYGYIIDETGIEEFDVVLNQINKLSKKVSEKIEALKNNNIETLEILINLIEEKDPYTRGHSERVMEMALILGADLNYKNIDELMESSLLHDIGKIGIDEKILNKPSKLTVEEFQHIKTHPERGEKVLGSSERMKDISKIILQHHERFDGNGYPFGISGEAIEMGARIIAVVDAFDAMTSDRSYRNAKSFEEAVSILIEEKNKQFDGKIVDIFLKNLEKMQNIIYRE